MKRALIDVATGFGVFILAQVAQFASYLVLGLLGVKTAFESAPSDAATNMVWRGQINTLFLVSALVMLVITALLAWIVQTRTLTDGLRRGLIWTAVVGVLYLAVGIGNGTSAMFATLGMWVFLLAVAVGPIGVGWLRGRRT